MYSPSASRDRRESKATITCFDFMIVAVVAIAIAIAIAVVGVGDSVVLRYTYRRSMRSIECRIERCLSDNGLQNA